MSIFSKAKMSTIEVFDKSKYFQEGIFIVDIKAVKIINDETFVVETCVVKAKSQHEEAPMEGQTAAHIWKVDNKYQMHMKTWMGFLTAALGCGVDTYSDAKWIEIAEEIVDENGLAGIQMFLEVVNTVTKKGNDFTVHNWKRQATEKDHELF